MIKHGFERTAMARMPYGPESSKPWEMAAPAVARPARSREADVVVPAMQAAITGVVGGALVGLAALGLAVMFGWPWYVTPAAIAGGAVVAAAVQWWRAIRIGTSTFPAQQTGTEKAPRLRVEVVEESPVRKHWDIDDLPVSREVLARVVRRVDAGTANWSRRGITSTPGIGDERARRLLADLERFGYLHYAQGRNHPNGAQPTAKGRALMRALSEN